MTGKQDETGENGNTGKCWKRVAHVGECKPGDIGEIRTIGTDKENYRNWESLRKINYKNRGN